MTNLTAKDFKKNENWMKSHIWTTETIYRDEDEKKFEAVGAYIFKALTLGNIVFVYKHTGFGNYEYVGSRKIKKGNKVTVAYSTYKLKKLKYDKSWKF